MSRGAPVVESLQEVSGPSELLACGISRQSACSVDSVLLNLYSVYRMLIPTSQRLLVLDRGPCTMASLQSQRIRP